MNDKTPFDLERALAGDPVITQNGKPVTQLHKFDGVDYRPILVVIDGRTVCWELDGKNSVQGLSLFMAPPPKKRIRGWVNVFLSDDGKPFVGSDIWGSQEEAIFHPFLKRRIACIEIDVEEGFGL